MLEGIGQDSRLFPGDGNKVRLKGLFRLRDWTPENAVRVALQQGSHLRIHVWGEGHGVSLFLTPAGAAYRITQQPGEALLKQDVRLGLATLLTTDDRRGARLPHAAYQVRCQDRAVVVTKGNIRVMTVPLEGPPKSIYLQVPNDAMLHDLAIFRSGPAPEEISPPHRVVLDGRRPTELPWKATLPKGARFEKPGDGSVEIAVENTADVAMASVAPAGPGLREVVAEFDEATPGTGITFLDAKGEPLDGIEFGREGKSTLAFGFGTPRGQDIWAISTSSMALCRWPVRSNGCGWLWPADRRIAGSAATASIGAECSLARPLRVLENDCDLRPGSQRSHESGQCGPSYSLAKPAGPRTRRAYHRRRGFARQGGGRRCHEGRPG